MGRLPPLGERPLSLELAELKPAVLEPAVLQAVEPTCHTPVRQAVEVLLVCGLRKNTEEPLVAAVLDEPEAVELRRRLTGPMHFAAVEWAPYVVEGAMGPVRPGMTVHVATHRPGHNAVGEGAVGPGGRVRRAVFADLGSAEFYAAEPANNEDGSVRVRSVVVGEVLVER